MKIKELKNRPDIATDKNLTNSYVQFGQLLDAIRKKEIDADTETAINEAIDAVEQSSLNGPKLTRLIKQKQTTILRLLEKKHKLVPKYHYQTLWMLFGMSGIGMPIGVAFGISLGNIGLLGLGLPIGMAIGFAIGAGLDKKAVTENRQLDFHTRAK